MQAVLTPGDELLAEGAKDRSVQALEEACATQVRFLMLALRLFAAADRFGVDRLREVCVAQVISP